MIRTTEPVESPTLDLDHCLCLEGLTDYFLLSSPILKGNLEGIAVTSSIFRNDSWESCIVIDPRDFRRSSLDLKKARTAGAAFFLPPKDPSVAGRQDADSAGL